MQSNRSLEILEALVGFDTVSVKPNMQLIDFAADFLGKLGARVEIVAAPEPNKASLWASLGPDVEGGVALSGHSDVVPVEGQDWKTDPFKLTQIGSRVYGRGTSDMKGFIACAMAALEKTDASKLKRPIHLALTYDEEIGCQGAPRLIEWLVEQGKKPSAVLVGEPTLMQVVNGHKGIALCKTRIRGVEAHSSLAHLGVSAVDLAGQFIALLKSIETELREQRFDPDLKPGYTTISVNRIFGGEAVNILAGHAELDWDIRCEPSRRAEEVLEMIHARLESDLLGPVQANFPDANIEIELISNAPPLTAMPADVAEALAIRLTGQNTTRREPYGAEAGQYQAGGYSSVLIGPGSIEQAHQPNEFIEISELEKCDRFLNAVIADLSH